jgi:hypothetical protein
VDRLARLAADGPTSRIDVWGGNFYPQASVWRLTGTPKRLVRRRRPGTPADLEAVLRACHEHVRRPIMLTETSVRGHIGRRVRWLRDLAGVVERLTADAVPLVGVTWFPAFSLLSWDYRRGRRPLEEYLAHYGLWDLRPDADGTLRRVPTALVDAYARLARTVAGG